MPQFFIQQPLILNETVEIKGPEAHHIADVLRLKKGDWLILADGQGRSYKSEITEIKGRQVKLKILAEISYKFNNPCPALAFAIIKHDRTEYIIQKAVELGCHHLYPFFSERTIPKFTTSLGPKKLERWQKIAVEAAKQSGLPFIPKVNASLNFEKLCASFSKYEKTLLFWEGETKNSLESQLSGLKSQVLLIIGPEGGFTKSEVELARKNGASSVSLGSQILRVETAAIASLAIVQYELGNFDRS
ncbi:MAG: RsmE family RNA methyltransferase [Pseudomonadota bacterium]